VPELPDIVVYIEALEQRILGQTLERVQIASPFLVRTAHPPISSVEGRDVLELRRLGKRICLGLEDDLWLVLHLMIAGRLHWSDRVAQRQEPAAGSRAGRGSDRVLASSKVQSPKSKVRTPKNRLATFQFTAGTLSLTEAGTQRRASLHVVKGGDNLERFNPGGLEVFETDLETFANALTAANHTLKRALTDPRLFSGIGNAYSDEILFDARLSPIALTQKLKTEEIERLFNSTRATLSKWIDLLRADVQTASKVPSPKSKAQSIAFPEKVTAFRPEMAVHGKYQQACPNCNSKVQRIRYASNETNYCPTCQTGGKLLADRALSRLLRADWPRSADELEGLLRENPNIK
jgi:formamidopyrimidine-DNA glycosylase